MNTLDIILGILLLLGLARGFFNGFLVELAGLLALIAGIYGAIYLSDGTLTFLQSFIDWEVQYLALIAFALTFIVIVLVVSMAGRLLTKMVNLIALGLLNRLLGGVFGLLKMAFLASVFFMFLNQTKTMAIGQETRENSLLYGPVEMIAPILLPTVLKVLENDAVFDKIRKEKEEEQL